MNIYYMYICMYVYDMEIYIFEKYYLRNSDVGIKEYLLEKWRKLRKQENANNEKVI